MLVRATHTGFIYNRRVRVGQTFEVPDGTKGKWFVPVSTPKEEPAKAPRQPRTLSELGRQAATPPVKTED